MTEAQAAKIIELLEKLLAQNKEQHVHHHYSATQWPQYTYQVYSK